MARRNKEEMLRKQKEAKQKKLLFVLLPLFLGLVVWQGPKMYKAFLGPKPEATPPPAATTPVPADPAAAGTTTTPVAGPGTPAPAGAGGGLVDTDVPPEPAPDRLVSFGRFASRDPFGRPGGGAGPQEESVPEATASSAVIEVNGTAETVDLNGEFPAGDPTFRLVSLTPEAAVLGLVSGAFEGGQGTVELAVGEQVELVAEPDGTRYVVTLVSVGSE